MIDKKNVFGGFTQANWKMTKECNSTNGYAFDYDAFIFSLINPYGKPFKSRVTNP